MIDRLLKYGPQLLAFAVFLPAVAWTALRFRRLTPSTRHAIGRFLVMGFAYLLATSCVLNAFMARWGFRGDSPKMGFELMVNFESERPFVYRMLSPFLVRAVVDAIPASFAQENEEFLLKETALLRYKQPAETWTVEKSLGWHVAYALQFLFIIAGLLAARLFLQELVPGLPEAVIDFGPPVGALFLMMTFIHGGYMYDFPELLFLLMGAAFISMKRWVPYALVFFLAILNKETGVFLAVYFAALQWDAMPRRRLAMLTIAQLVVGAVVIAGVRHVFRASAGAPMDNWIPQHLMTWTNPLSYMKFFDFSAPYIWIPRATNILTLALLGGLIASAWPSMTGGLRRLLIFLVPINTVLVLLGGFPDEVRNFSLLFPPLFAVGALGVCLLYRDRDSLTLRRVG